MTDVKILNELRLITYYLKYKVYDELDFQVAIWQVDDAFPQLKLPCFIVPYFSNTYGNLSNSLLKKPQPSSERHSEATVFHQIIVCNHSMPRDFFKIWYDLLPPSIHCEASYLLWNLLWLINILLFKNWWGP